MITGIGLLLMFCAAGVGVGSVSAPHHTDGDLILGCTMFFVGLALIVFGGIANG